MIRRWRRQIIQSERSKSLYLSSLHCCRKGAERWRRRRRRRRRRVSTAEHNAFRFCLASSATPTIRTCGRRLKTEEERERRNAVHARIGNFTGNSICQENSPPSLPPGGCPIDMCLPGGHIQMPSCRKFVAFIKLYMYVPSHKACSPNAFSHKEHLI